MNFDVIYILAGGTGLAVALYKLWGLRRRWGQATVWSLVLSVSSVSACALASAPQVGSWINAVTGIPNLGFFLAYEFATIFSAATLALVLFWRHHFTHAWHWVRRIIGGYSLVLVILAATFFAADLPTERLKDFDSYYAHQPSVATFITVYGAASILAAAAQLYQCWSASVEAFAAGTVRLRWLARGLRAYMITASCPLAVSAIKILNVVALWADSRALTTINTAAPVLSVAVGAPPLVAAVVLPVWGPRLTDLRQWGARWRRFWYLRPLHRQLRQVDPNKVLVVRRFDSRHRVRRIVHELNDWRWDLRPYLSPRVGEVAAAMADQAGLSGPQHAALVEAAQLNAALLRLRGQGEQVEPSPTAPSFDTPHDSADLTDEHAWWVLVARASHHPLVPAILAAVADDYDPTPTSS
ncbi:hypothetical protein GCM10012275_57690 [Longimycelium tulufanense]|uniref:DUF6545 domain-containing protein n=1 Tax=Longimycelium tulufanense TaxID=907463 RepID=A0A8J3CKV9_9PSEU|nr:MAB_1171c family putative transporter [Longimycelium tulufanense]GGM79515.1 hypothetical protein GCM10012275_57690 [Longimycelium tulufanense]